MAHGERATDANNRRPFLLYRFGGIDGGSEAGDGR